MINEKKTHPNKESLGVIVINTTSAWPESAGIGGLQETIT